MDEVEVTNRGMTKVEIVDPLFFKMILSALAAEVDSIGGERTGAEDVVATEPITVFTGSTAGTGVLVVTSSFIFSEFSSGDTEERSSSESLEEVDNARS